MIKKIILAVVILIFSVGNSYAAMRDFYDRSWWVNKSGIATGTINDIIFQYLGDQGFDGTINDRLLGWLAVVTGDETGSLNQLLIECFESTTACEDYPVGGVVPGQLVFLNDPLLFTGRNLTYNP